LAIKASALSPASVGDLQDHPALVEYAVGIGEAPQRKLDIDIVLLGGDAIISYNFSLLLQHLALLPPFQTPGVFRWSEKGKADSLRRLELIRDASTSARTRSSTWYPRWSLGMTSGF
jgi:hypothetical protein